MPQLEHPASGDAEPDGFSAWLAIRSGSPGARPEARQRARLAFLSAASAAAPVAPPSRSYRTLVWLAAAAAIAAVTFLVPEPDHWRVRLEGGLVLDEEDFAPGEEGRLAVELERSGWAETRLGRARFSLGGLEVELLPDSRLAFPALPELDGVAPVDFELARGEAYLRTLGAYPGNPIRIRTDSAEVVLSGTTVGVLVDEEGTCVCVAEGSVRVTSGQLASGSEDLPSLQSLRLFRGGAMGPKSEPFDSEGTGPAARHVQELLAFQQGH